jgi:peptidyl-tRNA hydrolase, PTH1 family
VSCPDFSFSAFSPLLFFSFQLSAFNFQLYPMLKLLIGLGNPGRQYDGTRHNVGFMVLDRIAGQAGVAFESAPKWQSHLAKLPDGTLLMKPQTFMNLSGRAVQQLLAFHKWSPQELLVVYDDAALALGTLRFREKGSAGGHNGIKSMIELLGTQEFPRLKVGIGGARGGMTGHVLGRFLPDELPVLENTLARAGDAVQLARSQGFAAAANQYHAKIDSTNPTPDPSHHEPQIPGPDRP